MSSIVPAPIARQPWQMLFPLFVLIAFGALVLFSAAGGSWDPYASSHVIRFSVFLVMAFVLSRFSRELVLFFAFPIYGVVLAMLLAVEAIGFVGGGSQRWLNLGEVLVIGGWDLVAGQEILGEGFRAFQLCSAFARPEDLKTFSLKRIYHTYYQWRFRTNNGESDSVFFGKCHQCFYVSR